MAFAVLAMLLSLAGTPLFSTWADTFVFTWPASLYIAFRLLLAWITWVEAQPKKKRLRWASRLLTLLFLAFCVGYFLLCQAIGYTLAWSFLAGFLPAAPAAILAARARRWWIKVLAEIVAFAAFFWVAGLLPTWKDRWLS